MAIAMHCRLRPPDAESVIFRCNWDACAKFEVGRPIMSCCLLAFLLLIPYFTPWPWPLTIDLERLQYIGCDVVKLCTKSERNRTIRGGVIATSIFDLMTLNMCHVLTHVQGIVTFTPSLATELVRPLWLSSITEWWSLHLFGPRESLRLFGGCPARRSDLILMHLPWLDRGACRATESGWDKASSGIRSVLNFVQWIKSIRYRISLESVCWIR